LLDFLARMADPLVRPDTGQATRLVTALNSILAPDGWELRTSGFVSDRPVYAASRTAAGLRRMIRLDIGDDDAGQLDVVLGQAHHLLGGRIVTGPAADGPSVGRPTVLENSWQRLAR